MATGTVGPVRGGGSDAGERRRDDENTAGAGGASGTALPTQTDGGGDATAASPGRSSPGGAAGADPTGAGTDARSGASDSSDPADGPRTASDRGVTADTIRVGALLLDVATVGRLGVGVAIDPNQQQAAFQAFFDEINARGGIHGRMIEGHYEAYDVTSTDDQIRACRSLTQDKKVFAVLGGFNTSAWSRSPSAS